MGTTPVSRIIYAALRDAGVMLAAGRTPSHDQYSDCLDEINRMIGTANCERPRIFTISVASYALTGAKTYTIGKDPSGVLTADFDADRPQEIQQASLIFPNSPAVRRPVKLLTDAEWAQIAVQDIPNSPVFYLYNDGNYPFSTLYVWPQAPTGYSLELYTWQAIPYFTSVDDVVTLPPGYEDWLVKGLAVRLDSKPWPAKVTMNPQVRIDAQKALAAIASRNLPPPPKISSSAPSGRRHGGYFNYVTGDRA